MDQLPPLPESTKASHLSVVRPPPIPLHLKEVSHALWNAELGRLKTRLPIQNGSISQIALQVERCMLRVNDIAPFPVYFIKDDQLIYRRPRDGQFFTPRSSSSLGIHLDENMYVEEVRYSKGGGPPKILEQPLNKNQLDALMERPPLTLPRLLAVVHTPFLAFTAEERYEAVTTSGYHAPSKFWLDLPEELQAVNEELKRIVSIEAAVSTVFDDLLFDFKTRWPSKRDRAHYLAVMCEPFVRPLINGVTPLNFFSADDPGSGKSLLARFHGAVAFGIKEKLAATPWSGNARDDHAMIKMFPGVAADNGGYIFMDNLKAKLNSPNLAQMATEGSFKCDVKYLTAVPTFDIRWQWLLTGNKPDFDYDLGRRMLRVAIQAQPRAFDVPNTKYRWNIGSIAANRARFVAAILFICREGLQAGTALEAPRFDSFEPYMRVLWPIMVNAGFSRDFDPAMNTLENESDEGVAWEAFARAAFREQLLFGAERGRFTAKTLWQLVVQPLALDIPGLPPVGMSDHSQSTALGKALSKAPKSMGAYTMTAHSNGNGKTYEFALVGPDAYLPDDVIDAAREEDYGG